MNKIDLHIHSSYSDDGELTPYQILQYSTNKRMQTISITDHNSVKGVDEAIEYGKHLGVEVIPGIEIDCSYNNVNLHLLGYYIDYTRKEFEVLEKNLFEKSMTAFPQAIINLEKIGIYADVRKILKKANGRPPTGELIAEVILENEDSINNKLLKPYLKGGTRSNMPYLNFYLDFFAQGKIAHVPIEYLSLKAAINLVKDTGGIPIIAHPGINLKNNMEMLDFIIKEGIEGIEVFSNYHTSREIDYFYKKAKEYGLLITCGSDFHGKYKPGIEIGMCNCTLDETKLVTLKK